MVPLNEGHRGAADSFGLASFRFPDSSFASVLHPQGEASSSEEACSLTLLLCEEGKRGRLCLAALGLDGLGR
jgi:hypothetical protein